jgi:hypothetical protein
MFHSRRVWLGWALLGLLATAVQVPTARAAITIPEGDLNPLSAPCSLTLSESNLERVLTWSAVSGAVSYKVGFIRRLEIVGLVETSATTTTHTGFSPEDCLEYVVVAYDGGGHRVCAARAPRIGKCP